MKEHHLYKIENSDPQIGYYLYVIQKIDCSDSMDILAIRSDFMRGILPLYSPAIPYKKDFGHPTAETLISIDSNFYSTIKTATIMLNLKENLQRNNNADSFLKDQILGLCSVDIHNVCNGIRQSDNTNIINCHLVAAAINRILGVREAERYVQDQINTQTDNS